MAVEAFKDRKAVFHVTDDGKFDLVVAGQLTGSFRARINGCILDHVVMGARVKVIHIGRGLIIRLEEFVKFVENVKRYAEAMYDSIADKRARGKGKSPRGKPVSDEVARLVLYNTLIRLFWPDEAQDLIIHPVPKSSGPVTPEFHRARIDGGFGELYHIYRNPVCCLSFGKPMILIHFVLYVNSVDKACLRRLCEESFLRESSEEFDGSEEPVDHGLQGDPRKVSPKCELTWFCCSPDYPGSFGLSFLVSC